MQLIYLHGSPAVGKFTIARTLAEVVPARLCDNHATIDLGRTLFDFGTDAFWDLVSTLRLNVISAAARSNLPYLITTSCYDHPADLPQIEQWENVLHRNGATLLPVFLTCSFDTLRQRVVQPERARRRKLHTVAGLDAYIAKFNLQPLPRPDCVTIDTDTLSPQQSAARIIRACDLTAV